MNGQVTINIGGKDRTFKFGLYVVGETQITLGIGIEELDVWLKKYPIKTLAAIMFHSAVYHSVESEQVIDYRPIDIYGWLDNAGGLDSEPVQQFINALMDSMSKDVPVQKKSLTVTKASA